MLELGNLFFGEMASRNAVDFFSEELNRRKGYGEPVAKTGLGCTAVLKRSAPAQGFGFNLTPVWVLLAGYGGQSPRHLHHLRLGQARAFGRGAALRRGRSQFCGALSEWRPAVFGRICPRDSP